MPGPGPGSAGRSPAGPTTIDTDDLKRRHQLAGLAHAAGVHLRRIGAGTWQGLCPFHKERTASFTIYEADSEKPFDRFICFGCGARGDVIDFVCRHEGRDFTDACQRLGTLSPAPTPVDRGEAMVSAGGQPDRRRDWEALEPAERCLLTKIAEHYHRRLLASDHARTYAHFRGISPGLIDRLTIGYADGESLIDILSPAERGLALDLHLLKERPGRPRARPVLREHLGGRLVIPERRGGEVIWFIGRAIPLLDQHPDAWRWRDRDPSSVDWRAATGPKYLSLPGKRPILGYEYARDHEESLLCEGVFDWLFAVGLGLAAWSPCGTVLTAERLRFLHDARTVYGGLDADRAGMQASTVAAEIFGERWVPIALPAGTDLGDLAMRRDGEAYFRALLAEARSRAEAGRQRGTAVTSTDTPGPERPAAGTQSGPGHEVARRDQHGARTPGARERQEPRPPRQRVLATPEIAAPSPTPPPLPPIRLDGAASRSAALARRARATR